MKTLLSLACVGLLLFLVAMLFKQRDATKTAREENQSLRLRITELEAENEELSRRLAKAAEQPAVPREYVRELEKLRAEVTTLRQQRDNLAKQTQPKEPSPQPAQPSVDLAWVDQVLASDPRSQGKAVGALRGKQLRRESGEVSPSELALRDALLKRQLNQTLERSPGEFADFQTSFIQSALNIEDASKARQIHDLIRSTYEHAVANGLDIPSKPATGTDEWVKRRFELDRAATKQLQGLLTPGERALFDQAFLGVMGVDLGGVGVDKSNYPKGFLGE